MFLVCIFYQILHFFSLLPCNKKILYVTLVINKGVVNRYMFIAPFAFIKKGDLNVGITLKQLYEQTKVKFKIDIYKKYINKNATEKQQTTFGRPMCCFYEKVFTKNRQHSFS